MATLADRLTKQLADLQAERAQIEARSAEALAEVDEKIEAVIAATKIVSKELESTYGALLRLKLIREV